MPLFGQCWRPEVREEKRLKRETADTGLRCTASLGKEKKKMEMAMGKAISTAATIKPSHAVPCFQSI